MATRKEFVPQEFDWRSVQFGLERIFDDVYRRLPTAGTPVNSSDPSGQDGDVWYDASYLYIKQNETWYRTAIATW